MSTFQITIFEGQSGVVVTPSLANGFSTIIKTGINIPFQINRRVKVISIDCIHHDLGTGFNVPLLCVLKSDQIYNPVAGSRDIFFSSNGINDLNDIYLNDNFQNNENITIKLENLNPARYAEFTDYFQYFIMTLKIV
jgi:hypothetical protein